MSKYPIRFKFEDKETWPRIGQFVIVTDPSNPFPYTVEQFVLLDKHLHETQDRGGVPTLGEGQFWMPLPAKMHVYGHVPIAHLPSQAVARVQRDKLTHKYKSHE